MTSIKEAWQNARKYVSSHADAGGAAEAIIAMDKILAQLESADARETIARIMVRENPNYSIFHMPGEAPRKWKALSGGVYETSPLSEDMAERLRVQADAILATGLVPDEAAIRADERAKCANICRQIGINAGRRAAEYDNDEARNSALDKMEGAIQCEAAIRAGRAEK